MKSFDEEEINEELFDSRKLTNNQYSTFIEELNQATEEIMDEVFNKQYHPTTYPQKKSNYQPVNKNIKTYKNYTTDKFYTPKIYKLSAQEQLSQSFRNFLFRSQKHIEQKNVWIKKQQSKKQLIEQMSLRDFPQNVKGSQKVSDPIYERCIDLHRSQQKKIQSKRIQKKREEAQQISSFSFQPQVIKKSSQRTLEQYIQDKESWQRNKIQHLENKKIAEEAKKYMGCTFTPNLVAKYKKPNSKIISGERVEDRLLRSLEKISR